MKLFGQLGGCVMLVIVAVCGLIGCSPVGAINALTPSGHIEITRDVAFGPNARHRLDIYRPLRVARDGPLPVIVFFYGGGWSMGSRKDYLFVGEALARRGFVVVIPDYRLYPEVRFPAFVEDGAAAVQWVLANAERFKIDPRRVFLSGHSAGAHTAALLAYDPRYLNAAGADASAIRGFAGLAGPYWFRTWTLPAYAPVFEGSPRDDTRPIKFASAGDPPTLLLHGLQDETVSPKNTRRLTKRLQEVGVRVETELYEDIEHLKIVGAIASTLPIGPPVADRIAEFFNSIPAPKPN